MRVVYKIAAFFLVAQTFFLLKIWVFASDQKSLASGAYNVVVIMLDSVRADHLDCYGYARNTSPAIDKFAAEGVLFEQAISQSTWSLASHCSIVTSKYVPSHGVYNAERKLLDSEVTLPGILKDYGYATAAFTGGFWISSVFNVGKDFDIYQDDLLFAKFKDTSARAVQWLTAHKQERFFLFVQGFDGHSPYDLPKKYETLYTDPSYNGFLTQLTLDHRIGDRLTDNMYFPGNKQTPIPVTRRDIDYIIAHYDGALAYADQYIGEFLQKLDSLGLHDNTIVILTSYHGTPLFEHGIILRRLHGGGTEGTIRVPLIIRHPQPFFKGKKVVSQVQLIDVMPTILDLLNIPVNHQAQGKSLVPLIENKAGKDSLQYAYCSGFKENIIRTQEWKLIEPEREDGMVELYNLQRDPQEKLNVANVEDRISAVLKQQLHKWFADCVSRSPGQSNIIEKRAKLKIERQMKDAGYWFVDVPENQRVYGSDRPETTSR